MGHPAGPARRLRSLLWKPRLDEEIADELAFHLEMRARDYAARGMAPAAAMAAARRRFGDLDQVKAACSAIGRGRDRAQRRARWLGELARDLRLAGRRLGELPGPTLLALLALAVGLAGAATAWRVARAVLRPPPYDDPASLVRLRQVSPRGIEFAAAASDFDDWHRYCRSFSALAAFETFEANIGVAEVGEVPSPPGAAPDGAVPAGAAAEPPERVLAVRATASLLPLLGVRPLLGRGFLVGEDSMAPGRRPAVLSDALWRRRFAGDPRIVGRTLWLDGMALRVVGVMPAGFAMPAGAGLWLPLRLHTLPPAPHRLEVLARLRPGVSQRQAAADLASVAATAARFHPATNEGWSARVETLPAGWAGPRWTRRARLLLAAAALLWLLASVSAANLLWARATARQREIDLRSALGGGRGRIVRQLFAEGLLLALLGAAGGMVLAGAATSALRQVAAGVPQLATLAGPAAPAPPAAATGETPESEPAVVAAMPRLDLGSAGLILALALLSSLVCGVGPALQALRPGHDTARGARLTTRRERRVRDGLVVAELAVATTLLVAAGLLLESYLRLERGDPGYDADHVLSLRLALNGDRYPPAVRSDTLRRLEAGLAGMPGAAAAGFVSTAPLAAERPEEPFTLEPLPAGRRQFLAAEWRVATPGFFRALGVRPLAGRLLDAAAGDRRGGREPIPVVVDATFARRAWAEREPLGQRLRWAAGPHDVRDLVVIGVVAEVRDIDLEAGPRPVLFLPYDELPWRAMALVVRPAAPRPAKAALAALAGAVRREIGALAPGLPVSQVRWLEVARRQDVAGPRLGTWLVALFAAAALALAVSGVYATAAAAVAQRTQEIAVRQALGAARRDVFRLVLDRGASLTLVGLTLGLAGALLFSRLLSGLLYEISATRAAAYAAGALLLASVALLATALPALRASRIAPGLALRRE